MRIGPLQRGILQALETRGQMTANDIAIAVHGDDPAPRVLIQSVHRAWRRW